MKQVKNVPWPDRLSGRIVLGSIMPAGLVLAWWLAVKSGTAVVPRFGEVLRVLAHPLETPPDLYSRSLAFSFMMTMIRLFLGFGLGLVTAVPLGFWAGRSRVVDRLLYPVVQMARPVNPIVLLPIATVIFGLSSVASVITGETEAWRHDVWDQVQLAMILILWWGAFFPIFLSAVHGVRSVRTSYLETATLMGASSVQVFYKVVLPHSLPSVLNGVRIGMGVTWLVLIAAEIFPGTRSGIGYMLCTACKTSDYQYTFAAIIVIGLTGLIMDWGIHYLEKSVGHWQAAER